MPSPNTPPVVTTLNNLISEVQAQSVLITSLEATVAAQFDHLEKLANLQRYMAESFYGANINVTGIWDGTDRYV